MKINLNDTTFLILIRLDSIHRLENIIAVTNQLCHYFNTNIVVLEAAYYNNKALQSLLNRKIVYQYVEDKDPVLYKTKYFNLMAKQVLTPYLAIWDADIVVDKRAVTDAIIHLRNGADIAYPYNGSCFNVSEIIRELYLKKSDIRILFRHKEKMELLYNYLLVGGAVLLNKEKYSYAGMENEIHYGWGNDDFDRYYRFVGLGLNIYRVNTFLFHLSHPRILNSSYRSSMHDRITSSERFKTESSSKEDLLNEIHLKSNSK